MHEVIAEKLPDVFILCGGQGTRFREVREDIPKALAPINGKPFIDLLLDNLVEQGCQRIILGTGYLSEKLEEHIRHRNDAEYLISRETQPLGTGGAIRHALPLIQSEEVLVLNGDSMIKFSIQELINYQKEKQPEATVVLSSNTKGMEYGNVELDEQMRVKLFHEKPKTKLNKYINAGIYYLRKKLIYEVPLGVQSSLEKYWLPKWSSSKVLYGFPVAESVLDIGTKKKYFIATKELGHQFSGKE